MYAFIRTMERDYLSIMIGLFVMSHAGEIMVNVHCTCTVHVLVYEVLIATKSFEELFMKVDGMF